MMAMPNFTPLPSRTKPDPGDDCRAAGTRALIGEKSQGDKHPGFNHVPGDGTICPAYVRGQPLALERPPPHPLLTLAT